MCDCITKIEEAAKKDGHEDAGFMNYGFKLTRETGEADVVLYSTIEYVRRNKKGEPIKAKGKLSMLHEYCPFCGEKIKSSATSKEVKNETR